MKKRILYYLTALLILYFVECLFFGDKIDFRRFSLHDWTIQVLVTTIVILSAEELYITNKA